MDVLHAAVVGRIAEPAEELKKSNRHVRTPNVCITMSDAYQDDFNLAGPMTQRPFDNWRGVQV